MQVLLALGQGPHAKRIEPFLRALGLEPLRADSEEQCVRALTKKTGPRLAILEAGLPRFEAHEVCARVRAVERTGYVYLLVLASEEQSELAAKALHAGADAWMTHEGSDALLGARLAAARRLLARDEKLRQEQRSAELRAMHDSLTGILGRSAILEHLGRELDRVRRAGGCVGTVMVDVDHFKRINDAHGHLVGDAVLIEVARRLAGAVRGYDAVGRYGGEEFMVVLSCRDSEEVARASDRVRRAVEAKPFLVEGRELDVSASVGVTATCGAVALRDAIRAADEALYRAKALGRNCVVFADAARAQDGGPAPRLAHA